ncbi:MAG: DNA polymerase I [Acidimicrobiales bacterium]|nr:DNA polymerase I [Acidimicrobiales bacterium]
MATLMLIDGNSLTYRAFYALPTDLATSSGQVTNAVYGFTSMLINLLRDHRPDGIAVAFDRPEPTFRHERVAHYKANRRESPDILRQQIGLVRQVVEALGIPVLESPGYEADDVIATVATRVSERGDDVLVVTGDRDVYQLVKDPHIKVLYNKRGVSDYVLYDEAGIEQKTGVRPDQYVEFAALRGDTSDNLAGVPGVGEKTAAKLIKTYGGIDGIYQHLEEQTPRLRENLVTHEAQVRDNAEVMRLVRDVPIDADLDQLRIGALDVDEIKRLFDFLEFHTLFDRLKEVLGDALDVARPDVRSLVPQVVEYSEPTAAADLVRQLESGEGTLAMSVSWAGTPGRSPIEGLAFAVDAGTPTVAYLPGSVVADGEVEVALAHLFAESGRRVVLHGAKELMRAFLPKGIDLRSLAIDTMVAAYLIDPAESRYVLDDLVLRYAGVQLEHEDGAPAGQFDFDGGQAHAQRTAAEALAVAALVPPLISALEARGLRSLHDEIEVPLVRVLAKMEVVGIGVDVDELKALNEQMATECAMLTRQIWADAGEEFNVNSTPQLRRILFEKLGLSPQKRTKTGFSTDAASLEKLLGQHPIIEHLLRYREVEKLRSTYGEGLLSEVGPDGRIHATFNQTVARTGRLSSDAPNLHNIPVRREDGRSFRRAFVAAPGYELLVADYNQIELRCIAHLSQDPGLIAAFESGQDIHTATAARVFGVEPAQVTSEQRSKAKMVSYGLAYGMEAYGLAQRLGIETKEAQKILDSYFEAFPAVRDYMERVVAEAREKGYTETLFGRRRQIPELSSSNFRVRQAGERQAKNAGIQGLAADIFKVALVRLDRALEQHEVASRLILQVHDEVIVEVADGERDLVTRLTLDAMCGAFELRVPLKVNLSYGHTWADAKG